MTDTSADMITTASEQSRPAPWSLSSKASVAAAVFAVISVALITAWGKLLNDPDTYWHIEIGNWIVANGRMPSEDLWSHTFSGQPWIAKEWLSQVFLSLAHSVAGWRGATLLSIVAFASSVAGLAYWLQDRIKTRYALCAVAIVFLICGPSLLVRPHVVVLPIMMIWTLGLLTRLERANTPPWWLLGVMVIWANMHAGFTIGFVIAFFVGLEAIANAKEQWLKTGLQWAAFGVLAIGASCVGPYGFGSYLVTLKLFGSTEATSRIIEWQPLVFDQVGIISLALFALLLLGLSTKPRQNFARIGLVLVLGYMMIEHLRFGLLFALTAIPFATVPIAQIAPRLAIDAKPPNARSHWWGPGLIGLFALVAILAPAPLPASDKSPNDAFRAAKAAGLSGNVYNSYQFGGFLIYNHVPTYVDGRTDQLFVDGFLEIMDKYAEAANPNGLIAQLDKTRVTWALLEPTAPEIALLTRAGWKMVHRDKIAVVLARP
jgi:hypothetical protein